MALIMKIVTDYSELSPRSLINVVELMESDGAGIGGGLNVFQRFDGDFSPLVTCDPASFPLTCVFFSSQETVVATLASSVAYIGQSHCQ